MKTIVSFDYTDEQRRKIAYFLDLRYGNGKSHGRALATRAQITDFINKSVDMYWNTVEDVIEFNASDAVKNNIFSQAEIKERGEA